MRHSFLVCCRYIDQYYHAGTKQNDENSTKGIFNPFTPGSAKSKIF